MSDRFIKKCQACSFAHCKHGVPAKVISMALFSQTWPLWTEALWGCVDVIWKSFNQSGCRYTQRHVQDQASRRIGWADPLCTCPPFTIISWASVGHLRVVTQSMPDLFLVIPQHLNPSGLCTPSPKSLQKIRPRLVNRAASLTFPNHRTRERARIQNGESLL